MKRTKIAAANWKMYKTPQEAEDYFEKWVAPKGAGDGLEVVFFPSTILLDCVSMHIKGDGVEFGAQNIHFEKEGAYTGETSALPLLALGAKYALVGHSERRTLFGETDMAVAKKVRMAQTVGLVPMLCIGETLEERQAGQTMAVLERQILAALGERVEGADLVIAYEPVWAIGTGQVATLEQVSEVHSSLRKFLLEKFPTGWASAVSILYGGSVKAANAKELAELDSVDGFLVGGASLKPDEFMQITSTLV